MTPVPRLDHVALWTRDLDRLRAFYARWFDARAGARYESATRAGFASYFLAFPDGGPRLELMALPALADPADGAAPTPPVGWAHVALALGSRDAVDALAARMREAGVPVLSGPRVTGDGYYEALLRDPDGNLVEIVA